MKRTTLVTLQEFLLHGGVLTKGRKVYSITKEMIGRYDSILTDGQAVWLSKSEPNKFTSVSIHYTYVEVDYEVIYK